MPWCSGFRRRTVFSGEDMAEFHVHGGRAVIGAVVEALAGLEGLKPADPGEFTRRAFENGKLDLTEVEGLADLIDAETEAQRRQALSQSRGRFRLKAEQWREELLGAMALVESALDFSDEGDVGQEVVGDVRRPGFAALSARLPMSWPMDDRGNVCVTGIASSGRAAECRQVQLAECTGAPRGGHRV